MTLEKNKLFLDDVEWREFRIKDIFETFHGSNGLQTPTGSYIPKKNLICSSIPRITVRETNNGIDSFSFSKHKNFRVYDNFISVSFMGSAFYHPYEASLDMKVHALVPLDFELTKNISIFLIRSVNNNTKYYSYGNQLSSTDLAHQRLFLPIDSQGNLNLAFMEFYIKQEQKDLALKVIKYYEQKIIETGFDLVGLEDIEWKVFSIEDIFRVESVKGKPATNYELGDIPYVTTSSQNNGVNNFVDSKNSFSNGKAISVDPIAGKAFYHDYDFIGRGGAGSAINLLYNSNLDKYNGQFICTALERVSTEKASYGLQLNGLRLKNTKLILPVDRNGNPHWKYMSQFMKKIEQKKLDKALKYIYI